MSYISNRNLTNVVGRIDYISNPKRQENIVDFCSLQDNDFWLQLAKENQEQFRATSNSKRAGRKAAEAREFIIALPQDIDTTNLAEALCLDFKNRYGVDCACAIHYKAKENNLHAHLIYSERERLSEPLVVEQKVAPRTYYYDAQGKKCKKADAVKVVPKGTITQKGSTRYFGNKIDFYKMDFVKDYKAHLENELDLSKFDNTRYFATKHIGKNNPKGEFISEYNELIGELNNYFDEVEGEFNLNGKTPKEVFCEQVGQNRFYVPEIENLRNLIAEFKELYPLTQKTAQNRFESLSDGDLLEAYENEVQWLTEAQSDYSHVFNGYDCSIRRLEKNAYWEEHQNYPIQWGEVDRAINRINRVVSDNELEVAPISEKATPSEALKSANGIMEALKELIDYVKGIIADLLSEISNRGLDTPDLEDREIDLHQSFY